MQDKIINVPEIAKFFGVSKKTVYLWCKEGNLPAFKIGQEWMLHYAQLHPWGWIRETFLPFIIR